MKSAFASDESESLVRAQLSLQKLYEEQNSRSTEMFDEIFQMIEFIDDVRYKWQLDAETNSRLKFVNESLERENRNLNAELCVVYDKCREAQAQVSALTFTTHSLRCDIEQFRQKFDEIKSILRDGTGDVTQLEQISSYFSCDDIASSNGSCSSISYDSQTNTDEAEYDRVDDAVYEWRNGNMRRFSPRSTMMAQKSVHSRSSGESSGIRAPNRERPTYTRLLTDSKLGSVEEVCDEINNFCIEPNAN